jgi:hypothetical protein
MPSQVFHYSHEKGINIEGLLREVTSGSSRGRIFQAEYGKSEAGRVGRNMDIGAS